MEMMETRTLMSAGGSNGTVAYGNGTVIEGRKSLEEYLRLLKRDADTWSEVPVKEFWFSFTTRSGQLIERCVFEWQQRGHRMVDVVWIKRGHSYV